LPQPNTLWRAGNHGHIHPSAMIEPERAVHLGLTFRADGQRTIELGGEG
jgi:hypothetical protein